MAGRRCARTRQRRFELDSAKLPFPFTVSPQRPFLLVTTERMDVVSLSQKYFATWNAHDAEGIKSLHAATCDPELIKLFSCSSNESPFNLSSRAVTPNQVSAPASVSRPRSVFSAYRSRSVFAISFPSFPI